ncbi:uncharacterized protein LOC126687821 [Mercurialis annua]|uniref:uncharacterized protein LOC126687821 n=1 Tax=Mercurialis annua TaxID=3986 RepID=UPI00215F6D1B|nr:uncharacterized protein LOC126687821 [Mercurialis annua]
MYLIAYVDVEMWKQPCERWLTGMNMEDKSLVAMVCWNLWVNRNNAVWNKKWGTVDSIIGAATAQLSAWKICHLPDEEMRGAELLQDDGRVSWVPPRQGWLKANCDIANFSNSQGTGLGIVVRDSNGVVVQARQVRLSCNISPRAAEAMGIREALSWLKDCQNLIIESDAMDVILEIRNPELSEDILIGDCAYLAKQLSNVSFNFVRRSANQAAYILAQNARSISGHQEWYCHFPEFLTNVTALDH